MNYKETLLFVARALTISNEKKNLEFVIDKIKNNSVDWDKVVTLSTNHYVFPTLYSNLKRQNLLDFIPKDLVDYMEHITQLNRDRNIKIIEQAKNLNSLLKEYDIEPIFMKGTAMLVQHIYPDIAERMVGDIDFIVPYSQYQETIEILTKFNYTKVHDLTYSFPMFKHYDRLMHPDKIAAVEIHKELIIEKYAKEFNYHIISKNTIDVDGVKVMSYSNQLNMAIIAKQINDNGQYYRDISLRNAYDVYVLSKKTDSLKSIENFKKIFNPLNNFLTICNLTFQTEFIQFKNTQVSKDRLIFFNKLLENKRFRKKHYKRLKRKLNVLERLQFILQSFFRRENRIWIYNRMLDKKWRKEKLIQFRIKKSNS